MAAGIDSYARAALPEVAAHVLPPLEQEAFLGALGVLQRVLEEPHARTENGHSRRSRGQGRGPPRNLAAERSLLGGLFENPSAIDEIVSSLSAPDFHGELERKVFEAMLRCKEDGAPIDLVAVKEHLDAEVLESLGGERVLSDLALETASSSRLGYYAGLIKEKALARQVIQFGEGIASLAREHHGSGAQLTGYLNLLNENDPMRMFLPGANWTPPGSIELAPNVLAEINGPLNGIIYYWVKDPAMRKALEATEGLGGIIIGRGRRLVPAVP